MIGLELTNVKFVAFTGKAALVMHSKGLPATTIHKLIYDTFEEEYEVMDKEGNKKKKTRLKFVKKTSLDEGIKLKGITLVPVKLYFKNNKLKVSLGVCRGKKDYDKRESIKQRDIKREVQKTLKNY